MHRLSVLIILFVWSLATWAARDPTMPANAASLAGAQEGDLVTMIIVSPKRKVAVVNGSFVNPGDTVGEEIIVDIRPEYVIMENTVTGERKRASVTGKDIKLYVE